MIGYRIQKSSVGSQYVVLITAFKIEEDGSSANLSTLNEIANSLDHADEIEAAFRKNIEVSNGSSLGN